MSAFSGPQHPGARRELKELRRAEATQRAAVTPWDRRRGSTWVTFVDGCARGYDRDGVEHAHVHAGEAHIPGGCGGPAARTPAGRSELLIGQPA